METAVSHQGLRLALLFHVPLQRGEIVEICARCGGQQFRNWVELHRISSCVAAELRELCYMAVALMKFHATIPM